MPKASSSSPKGIWGSTFRSVGETLRVLPDLFPIWKVIFTLTCGLVVTGLMICGVLGWEEDCAWTLFWGGRTSLLKNKFIESSECRSWRGRVECKGPMDSELLAFSVLVNMSVLLLLWLWSLVLGSLFSNRHSCSGEVRFRDISWASWKYPAFIYRGIKGKKSRFALSCSDCTESKQKTQQTHFLNRPTVPIRIHFRVTFPSICDISIKESSVKGRWRPWFIKLLSKCNLSYTSCYLFSRLCSSRTAGWQRGEGAILPECRWSKLREENRGRRD